MHVETGMNSSDRSCRIWRSCRHKPQEVVEVAGGRVLFSGSLNPEAHGPMANFRRKNWERKIKNTAAPSTSPHPWKNSWAGLFYASQYDCLPCRPASSTNFVSRPLQKSSVRAELRASDIGVFSWRGRIPLSPLPTRFEAIEDLLWRLRMKSKVLALCALLVVLSVSGFAAERKKRVAVFDFDYSTVRTAVSAALLMLTDRPARSGSTSRRARSGCSCSS